MSVSQAAMEKLKSIRCEISQRENRIRELKAVEQVLFELANPIGGGASQKEPGHS